MIYPRRIYDDDFLKVHGNLTVAQPFAKRCLHRTFGTADGDEHNVSNLVQACSNWSM